MSPWAGIDTPHAVPNALVGLSVTACLVTRVWDWLTLSRPRQVRGPWVRMQLRACTNQTARHFGSDPSTIQVVEVSDHVIP